MFVFVVCNQLVCSVQMSLKELGRENPRDAIKVYVYYQLKGEIYSKNKTTL